MFVEETKIPDKTWKVIGEMPIQMIFFSQTVRKNKSLLVPIDFYGETK